MVGEEKEVTNIIYAVAGLLILVGLLLLYTKYRIVIGGIVCEVTVKQFKHGATVKGFTAYNYIFSFTYNGKNLEKPSINSTFSPQKKIGKTCFIYYNSRRSKYVVNKSIEMEIISLFCIILGLLCCFL